MSCEILSRGRHDSNHVNQRLPRRDHIPLRPSPLRLPGFELSPSPVSRRKSHHGRSVSPNISPHWVSIETPNATTPPLERLKRIGTLEGLNNNGQRHRIDPSINAIIDKGFFQSDGQWTCYRRNYFSVICSYSLFPPEPESHIQLALPGSPKPLRVHGFAMTITAVVAGDIGHNIELVQHTPKRDKGPITKPVAVKLSAKTSTQSQRQQLIAAEHTFERVQFKQATTNNGKRRAQQQYHQLVVSLLADVGEHDADRFVKVAERCSVGLVVRGRSPGHYQNLARPSVGSMAGLPAAGSDIASEQVSQNSAAAAASSGMFRKSQTQSGTSPQDTQEKFPKELKEKKQARGQDITIPPSARKPGLQIKTEEEVVVKQESPDSYQPVTPQLKPLEGQESGDILDCEESSSSAGMTEETTISDWDEEDVYDTWIEDKKQSVINAVMRSLCKWLDSRLVYVRGMTSNQAETSGSSSRNADSCDHTQPSRGKGDNHSHPPKRRRTDPSDGDDEDGEEGVRKAKLAQRRNANEPLRFACPYFKRDPGKYCRQATCVGPGCIEIHRVKGHLYRRHALPPQCPRCWQDFKTEQLRDVHLQTDPPCHKKTNETNLDGFTKTQEKQLKSRKKSEMKMTDAGKWREMYQILFPDDDPATIPDPYHEEMSAMVNTGPSDSHTPAAFAIFARREFPRFVRRELEVLFQSEFQDVEERIRPRVQDIVLNLQPRLIALYEQSAGEVGGRTALTAEISTPLADKDAQGAQGAQGREVLSPLVPNPLADNSPSTSWLPNQISETPSFDFGIDWDLLPEGLFNYPLHGQFVVPQLEKLTQDDLQVVGRRQPTIGQA